MLINVRLMEQILGGQGDVLAELKAMEGRVRKRREEDRGWASTRNKLRKRIVAVESWHGAIHSVVAPRRTGTRSWGGRRVDTRRKKKQDPRQLVRFGEEEWSFF